MTNQETGKEAIVIGTAGYGRYPAPDGWKEQYESKLQAFADRYASVELNRTFYKLPQVRTAQRWRREAGSAFRFCLKAWQALTHRSSSPTWRKTTRKTLSDDRLEKFGDLRPNRAVLDAWHQTRAVADALNADVCVIQTPPSFGPSDEHVDNMNEFFDRIDRDSVTIAWEPRGDWNEHPEKIRTQVRRHDLIHVVDPVRSNPLDDEPWSYLRLHGRNEDRYDYRYDYSEDELRDLAERISSLASERERVYCMFNNDRMFENGASLEKMLTE